MPEQAGVVGELVQGIRAGQVDYSTHKVSRSEDLAKFPVLKLPTSLQDYVPNCEFTKLNKLKPTQSFITTKGIHISH